MKTFAEVYAALDRTTRSGEKVSLMVHYFNLVPERERVCLIALLSGWRLPRPVGLRVLRQWAAAEAGLSEWLFGECHAHVGDLAETIAMVLPNPEAHVERPLAEWIEWVDELRYRDERDQRSLVISAWRSLPTDQRLVFNKLLTGALRIGVSRALVIRALSEVTGIDRAVLSQRLMGKWHPRDRSYADIITPQGKGKSCAQPYPFLLAENLVVPPPELGAVAEWQLEWKWDGIRAQVIWRGNDVAIWSRGEELMTHQFPELAMVAARFPSGTVLDGEILAWRQSPLGFSALQSRIARKNVSRRILSEVPVVFMAYDLLEDSGCDIRDLPLWQRRKRLFDLICRQSEVGAGQHLYLSQELAADSWEGVARLREEARRNHVEGLMIKRRDASYGIGRGGGAWWKWKLAPLSVDAVLVYANPGHGRRAGLFSDYTFALRDGEKWVPFAKAYAGLTEDEIAEVDAFVRRNTLQRRGAARIVKAELVFEIGFAAVSPSTRHRSGMGVRFPRILRWRRDKLAAEADSLADLRRLGGIESIAQRNVEVPRQLTLFHDDLL